MEEDKKWALLSDQEVAELQARTASQEKKQKTERVITVFVKADDGSVIEGMPVHDSTTGLGIEGEPYMLISLGRNAATATEIGADGAEVAVSRDFEYYRIPWAKGMVCAHFMARTWFRREAGLLTVQGATQTTVDRATRVERLEYMGQHELVQHGHEQAQRRLHCICEKTRESIIEGLKKPPYVFVGDHAQFWCGQITVNRRVSDKVITVLAQPRIFTGPFKLFLIDCVWKQCHVLQYEPSNDDTWTVLKEAEGWKLQTKEM